MRIADVTSPEVRADLMCAVLRAVATAPWLSNARHVFEQVQRDLNLDDDGLSLDFYAAVVLLVRTGVLVCEPLTDSFERNIIVLFDYGTVLRPSERLTAYMWHED